MDYPDEYPTPPPESYFTEIRAFLNGGGDPNQRDPFHDTLLHVAVGIPDSYELVKELISAGSDINLVNLLGQTPLHIAVIYRNRQVVNTLIQYGALVNNSDGHGNTVLHFAVKGCADRHWNCAVVNCPYLPPDMDIIKKLLNHTGVNVNARNSRGYTPLLMAVKDQNLEIVKALLFKGRADANIGNYLNETPLHASVSYPNSDLDIAFFLLSCEACVCCLNNNGHNALDLVNERVLNGESRVIAELFVKFTAFFNKNNDQISSSLQEYPELLTLYKNCVEEINLMRMDIVGTSTSVHQFIYSRIIQKCTFQIETCKPIIMFLRAGRYPLYFQLIVEALKKCELFSILVELVISCRYESLSNGKLYSLISGLNAI